MFKKLLLFSTIAIIGGCETINQANQCDPDKNYIISNPQAIEEYKKLKSEGKIRSYYNNSDGSASCNNNECVAFDQKYFDFIEVYFNNNIRKGVYTITASQDLKSSDCMPKASSSSKFNKICYKATKNENNNIVSDYEWNFKKNDNVIVLEFKNIKKGERLFKNSYQAYSTGAIGGPGGGICPKSHISNQKYKFNTYTFP